MSAMISLDSVIQDYLSESEQSNHKYFRLWHLAFRGMETLGLDFFYQIKTIKCDVSANYTVTLPPDYAKWIKVGYLNGIGQIAPLMYNESISTFNDLFPTRIADNTGNSLLDFYSLSSPTFYNYYNGIGGYGNLYGLPTVGGYGGQFKIDETNGVILLDNSYLWGNLMMEYVARPAEGQEYYLPVQFREALIAWLAWKDLSNTISRTHMNLGDKQIRRKEFYNERRLAIARFKPFKLDQAYLVDVEKQRLTVKS